jgi:transposase-like protein
MTYSIRNGQGDILAGLNPSEDGVRKEAQEVANVNRETVYLSLEFDEGIAPEPTKEEIERLSKENERLRALNDRLGLALLMIAEGCEDPRGHARDAFPKEGAP